MAGIFVDRPLTGLDKYDHDSSLVRCIINIVMLSKRLPFQFNILLYGASVVILSAAYVVAHLIYDQLIIAQIFVFGVGMAFGYLITQLVSNLIARHSQLVYPLWGNFSLIYPDNKVLKAYKLRKAVGVKAWAYACVWAVASCLIGGAMGYVVS